MSYFDWTGIIHVGYSLAVLFSKGIGGAFLFIAKHAFRILEVVVVGIRCKAKFG